MKQVASFRAGGWDEREADESDDFSCWAYYIEPESLAGPISRDVTMTPTSPDNSPSAAEISGRHRDPMADLRRRIYARIAERIDPARTRHKPLSLLRQEAKRLCEQFLDSECPLLSRVEREGIVEEILTNAPGIGPLEELFRDATVSEILILAAGQVICKKNDAWVPANVRFTGTAQILTLLNRFAEIGVAYVTEPAATGALDIRLPNHFRLIAVLPPAILEVPPTVVFVRDAKTASASGPASVSNGIRSGPPSGGSGIILNPPRTVPASAGPASGVGLMGSRPGGESPASGPKSAVGLGNETAASGPRSGIFSGLPPAPPATAIFQDPIARVRERVKERIITSLAAAGVYDLSRLPLGELRKIVHAYVAEINRNDRLGLDDDLEERLTLEILGGMNR